MLNNGNNNNSSAAAAPGWLLLLVGVAIGQSSRSMDSLQSLLASFQSFVNLLVVPLYALCIILYLIRLIRVDWNEHNHDTTKQQQQHHHLSTPRLVSVPALSTVREDGKIDMNGSFKLLSNDNFDGFLQVQGVPWALRTAANQARPTHIITHVSDSITIQIKGIIESQTTYEIGGPPVETRIRSRVFADRMSYLDDGIIVRKTGENYDCTVTRRLSDDRQTITMTSRAIFRDNETEPVEAVQIFRRIA